MLPSLQRLTTAKLQSAPIDATKLGEELNIYEGFDYDVLDLWKNNTVVIKGKVPVSDVPEESPLRLFAVHDNEQSRSNCEPLKFVMFTHTCQAEAPESGVYDVTTSVQTSGRSSFAQDVQRFKEALEAKLNKWENKRFDARYTVGTGASQSDASGDETAVHLFASRIRWAVLRNEITNHKMLFLSV